MGLLSWRALPGHLRTLSPPGRLQVSASTWLCHRALETPGAQHLLVEHKVASGPKFVPINSSPLAGFTCKHVGLAVTMCVPYGPCTRTLVQCPWYSYRTTPSSAQKCNHHSCLLHG